MTFSKNGAGLIILVLSLFGLEVSEQTTLEALSAVGTLVSIGLMLWNQVGRSDVTGFIFKK